MGSFPVLRIKPQISAIAALQQTTLDTAREMRFTASKLQELAMPSERIIRPLLLLAVAFTLFMALLPHPPALPIDRFGDKFEHMLAFSVLAFLARFSFQWVSLWQLLEHLSFFGALIEVCQALPVLHRDCDPRDWIADTIAAGLVLVLAHWLVPRLGQGRIAAVDRRG